MPKKKNKIFHIGDIVYPANYEKDFFMDNDDLENMKHIYGVVVDYGDVDDDEREDERDYAVEWCDFSTHDKTKGYCPKYAWWSASELTRNQKDFTNRLEEQSSDEEEFEPLTEEELQALKVLKVLE